MSKLKQKAEVLRAVASQLDSMDLAIRPLGKDIIRRHVAQNSLVCCDVAVPLELLGHSSFDSRRHMIGEAGREIGHHIASKLEYDLANCNLPLRDPYGPRAFHTEHYRAEVYALTPSELVRLVEAAIDAGRGIVQ